MRRTQFLIVALALLASSAPAAAESQTSPAAPAQPTAEASESTTDSPADTATTAEATPSDEITNPPADRLPDRHTDQIEGHQPGRLRNRDIQRVLEVR